VASRGHKRKAAILAPVTMIAAALGATAAATSAINASGGSDLGPGNVGQPFAQDFFLSGGAGPYTWSLASGQLPPDLTLQTSAGPRDADNELAGTPTKAGTYTFTMRLTDYAGQQATQQFTLVIAS
jgi:Putative Ig domain